MESVYIITHIIGANDDVRDGGSIERIVTVATSIERAKKFIENEFIPQLKDAVRKDWAGSSEDTIKEYLPNFVEDPTIPNKYVSNNTNEWIVIDEYDLLQNN